MQDVPRWSVRLASRLFASVVVAIGLGEARPGRADPPDAPAPSKEQVSERTADLLAVWSSLQSNVARMRLSISQDLVSSGEFAGARARWLRTGLAIEGGGPITERASIGISPRIAYENLSFDGSDRFTTSPGGERFDRFEDFLDASLSVGASYRFDHGIGAELVTAVNLRQEVGAAFDDSLRVGTSIAGTYRRGRWLQSRLGVGIGADLGDDKLRVSPVYRIRLKPRPDLTLEASGLRGKIEWDLRRDLQISLDAGLDGKQYRLDKRGRPPEGPGAGALQRRQTSVGLGFVYRFQDWLRISGSLGVVLEEKLTVIDEDGDKLDERQNKDPSVIAGLRFQLRR
jgi:hypothetical protein